MFLTLAIGLTFTFGGGPDAKLVEALDAQTPLAFSLLADSSRAWPAATVGEEATTRREQIKLICARVGLENRFGDSLGLASTRWPREFYLIERRDRYDTAPIQPPKIELHHGLISAKTTDRPTALEYAFPRLAKPVSWHWYFQDARLWIRAKDVPEKSYVLMIAESIGAVVKESKSGYYLDLDPKAYRRRAVAMFDDLQRRGIEDVLSTEDYAYSSRVLQWIDDATLLRAMKGRQPTFLLDRPMTKTLRESADARLRRHFMSAGGSSAAAWQSVRQGKDFDAMRVGFYPSGSMAIYVPPLRKGDPGLVF